MTLVPYEWQNRFVRLYKGKGVVKAFAGTGKTYAAILLIKKRKYKRIIVAVPTRKLKNQWTEELHKYGVKQTIVETFHILSKERSKGIKCDLFVVDECHRSTSPIFCRIYDNINFNHILGLSATPNRSCFDYCGDVIIEVPLEEAKISDFTVFLKFLWKRLKLVISLFSFTLLILNLMSSVYMMSILKGLGNVLVV